MFEVRTAGTNKIEVRVVLPRGDSAVARGPFNISKKKYRRRDMWPGYATSVACGVYQVFSPPAWNTSVSGPRYTDKCESWWEPSQAGVKMIFKQRQALLAAILPFSRAAWPIPIRAIKSIFGSWIVLTSQVGPGFDLIKIFRFWYFKLRLKLFESWCGWGPCVHVCLRWGDLEKWLRFSKVEWTVRIGDSVIFESKHGALDTECSPRRNKGHATTWIYSNSLPVHSFGFSQLAPSFSRNWGQRLKIVIP